MLDEQTIIDILPVQATLSEKELSPFSCLEQFEKGARQIYLLDEQQRYSGRVALRSKFDAMATVEEWVLSVEAAICDDPAGQPDRLKSEVEQVFERQSEQLEIPIVHSGGALVALARIRMTEDRQEEQRWHTKRQEALKLAESKNREYLENFWFVIDSENCSTVSGHHLYGYAFVEDMLYVNCEIPSEMQEISLDCPGAFVEVRRIGNRITIRQDWLGAVGLYLYRSEDGYFAVSNSFFRLLRHLQGRMNCSLNADCATYFLAEDLASWTATDTMIKEISCLSRCVYLEIVCEGKKQIISKSSFSPELLWSVPLDSHEGIRLLDEWHERWSNLYGALISAGHIVSIDVSGGFDSRMGLAVLLSTKLDFKDVRFNSMNDGLATHNEDYEIASEIANKYHIALNKGKTSHVAVPMPSQICMEYLFMHALGWRKDLFPRNTNYSSSPTFCSGGAYGEGLREYFQPMSAENFIGNRTRKSRYKTVDDRSATKTILTNTYKEVEQYYGQRADFAAKPFSYAYMGIRGRSHFGRSMMHGPFSNSYMLAPLGDMNLYYIDFSEQGSEDTNLLVALILYRYCPGLLNVKFQGGRSIKSSTIARAKAINSKYPWQREKKDYSVLKVCNGNVPDLHAMKSIAQLQGNRWHDSMKKLFYSPLLKGYFCQFFGPEIYMDAAETMEAGMYSPLRQAAAVVGVATVLRAISDGRPNAAFWPVNKTFLHGIYDEKSYERLCNSLKIAESLSPILMGRIDIKNYGNGNQVHVLNEEKLYGISVERPGWLKTEAGQGIVVTGWPNVLHLDLRCEGSGTLKMYCRAQDKRDGQGKRIPLRQTYNSIRVDGKEMLSNYVDTSHDGFHMIQLPIRDGQIIRLDVECRPYPYPKAELLKIIGMLMEE